MEAIASLPYNCDISWMHQGIPVGISNMIMQGWVSFTMEGIKYCFFQSEAQIDPKFRFLCKCSFLPPSDGSLEKLPKVYWCRTWKSSHPSHKTTSFHECTKRFQATAFQIWLCKVESHLWQMELNTAVFNAKHGLTSDSASHAAGSLPLISS